MVVSIAQNAVLGLPSWRSKISSFSGGSWNGTYPRSNLAVLPLCQVARTTDATLASTQFSLVFDHIRSVGLAAIVAHNLTTSAQIRYRLWGDAGMTVLLFDSGFVDVFGIAYPRNTLQWGDPHWWNGKYTDEDLAGYNVTTPYLFPQLYLAAAMTVEISDTSNAAGYIQIGLFEVAQGWQFSVNVQYGLQFGIDDRSITTEALGGAETVQKMPPQRTWNGTIDYLPHDEAMARGFEGQRQYLTATPFLWWLDPLDTPNQVRNCVLGRFSKINATARAFFGRDTFPVNIKEVIG